MSTPEETQADGTDSQAHDLPVDLGAAVERVLSLADAVQRGDLGDVSGFVVARLIRVAVYDSTSVLLPKGAVR